MIKGPSNVYKVSLNGSSFYAFAVRMSEITCGTESVESAGTAPKKAKLKRRYLRVWAQGNKKTKSKRSIGRMRRELLS